MHLIITARLITIFAGVFQIRCLEMFVELEDDHGHKEKFNISAELEELLRDDPPFNVPKEDMYKDYKEKLRPRRSATMMEELPFKDRGTYFCHDLKTEDAHVNVIMNVYQLRDFFYSQLRFRVYYNLEVTLPSKIPIRRVDRKGKRFPKPLPEQVHQAGNMWDTDNLIYYTNWGDWTDCSVCGQEGERKRLGICTAKLWNEAFMTIGWEHIYYVLRALYVGAPCRSSLFHGYKRMRRRNRPDEMEYAKCFVKCAPARDPGKRFAAVHLEKINFLGLKRKVPEKSVQATVGDRVDLTCPGSTIDTLVYWINGTKYLSSLKLREKTKNRVEIDAYNVYVIHSALLKDSGFYTCWYAGRRRLIFKLKVNPPPGLASWLQHFIYLCYSFTVDFWIFVIIIAIRHKHRLVIRDNVKVKEVEPPEEPVEEIMCRDESE